MMRKLLYIVLLLLSSLTLIGQTVRLDARRGNKSYNRSNYSSARAAYLSSVARDSTYAPARLGLGDALYMSGDTVAAVQMWQRIASDSKADPRLQALAWHNLGNRCMDTQQYDKAIEAYKESLRRNPTEDVYKRQGLLVATSRQAHADNVIDLSQLPHGVYLVRLITHDGSQAGYRLVR